MASLKKNLITYLFISGKLVLQRLAIFLLLLLPFQAFSIDAVSLKLANLEFQQWQIQNIYLALANIEQENLQLELAIEKLKPPKPIDSLEFINIRCLEFTWSATQIECKSGNAELKSSQFDSPHFKFSFFISEKQSYFKINQLKWFKGAINIDAQLNRQQWQLKLNGKHIQLQQLQHFLTGISINSGKLDLKASATGNLKQLYQLKLDLKTKDLTLQTEDGSKATEKLALNLSIKASNKSKFWKWKANALYKTGSLYIQPVFLQQTDNPLSFVAEGIFNPKKNFLEIDEAVYQHPNIGVLKAHGFLELSPFNFTQLNISGELDNLEQASRTYLDAFLETSAIEGLTLFGKLDGQLYFKNNTLSELNLISQPFSVSSPKQKLHLQNGSLSFNWSNEANYKKNTYINWQKLDLFSIPLEQAYLSLLFKQKQLKLLKPVEIALLDGKLNIKRFDWQSVKEDNPKVHFSGNVKQISLEKLAQAFEWKPLSGTISGDIPSVGFDEGLLQLDGGLKINIFDGEINIKKLALSGLIKGFPQFYSDIEIKQLDLDLLTQRFEFGGIKGRVSGYIRDLYMENWKPVQFLAWLGTPEGDESDHQISQKAVENLASIGGGGAVDFVSRMFLSVFDSFEYEQIGLGCYLNNGVCQLMGVEAAGKRGYYIVKGGGVPRIDVMGYNPRVDWDVLWERLSRVTQTDEVVVE